MTDWLEVRVLPAPPRSPAQTGISRFSANRPELAEQFGVTSADQGAGKQLKLRDCRSGDSGRIPYQP
jgi:hypothetical protein